MSLSALQELTRREVEYIALSRDTTESDLKQRREIRAGSAFYVDQASPESWRRASDPGCDGARGGAGARGLCGFVKWQGSSFCSSDSCRCAVLSSDGFDVGFWFFCSWKCLLGLVRNEKLDEIKGSAVLAKDHDADFLIFSYFLLLAYRNLIFKKN